MFNLYKVCFKIASRHQFTGWIPPCGIYADTIEVDVQYSFSSLTLPWALAEVTRMAGKECQRLCGSAETGCLTIWLWKGTVLSLSASDSIFQFHIWLLSFLQQASPCNLLNLTSVDNISISYSSSENSNGTENNLFSYSMIELNHNLCIINNN